MSQENLTSHRIKWKEICQGTIFYLFQSIECGNTGRILVARIGPSSYFLSLVLFSIGFFLLRDISTNTSCQAMVEDKHTHAMGFI